MVTLTDDFAWDETNGSGASSDCAEIVNPPLPLDAAGGGLKSSRLNGSLNGRHRGGCKPGVLTLSEIVEQQNLAT